MKPILLVLAAGMGSRYGGVKQIEAVGLNNECLLDFATYDAKECGYKKVVFIIRKDIEKDFRERIFDNVSKNFDAEYVFQSNDSLLTDAQKAASAGRAKPWGTTHAVLCAEKLIDAPFAVINSDDYYGREALATLGKYLESISNESTEHAMVGYVLKNTMSRSGSVSRGVCTVQNDKLSSIEENLKIYYEGEKIISEKADGSKVVFSGDEWVSMNLFGFSPKAFEYFHTYWDQFMTKNASAPKAEAILSATTGDMIEKGAGQLKFFTTAESWFGMTYPEDRAEVRKQIAEKITRGYYPSKLWH